MPEKQICRRICDHCGLKEDFDQSAMRPSDEEAFNRWICLVRTILSPGSGQPIPLMKFACHDTCAVNILKTGFEVPDFGGKKEIFVPVAKKEELN